ncbi:reverse transcriptase domain-containing protein [Staphylococcus aureus]
MGKLLDHLNNLREVFQRLKDAGMKLSPKKCSLFGEEVKYLGHIVSEKGISTDRSNT